MKRRFAGLSDPGLVRSVNQDDYYIDPEGRFFIIADGMGGHAGGQEASHIATEVVKEDLEEYWESPRPSTKLLNEALERANLAIVADQQSNPERGDMGTTAVVMIFRQGESWCAHVGDSRLYRLRGSQLEQITEDHTWVSRATKAGDLTLEQARVHPWRHVLSQCLGRKDLQHIEIQTLEVKPGDRLLLCSDGLTEELSDEVIGSYLITNSSSEQIAKDLVEEAKKEGGSDNITVVVVEETE
ncbi:MAG: Stp1/IreP family PP2C-type Ser/Thr phosphatase [Spirulinaceae cyanobacterium]